MATASGSLLTAESAPQLVASLLAGVEDSPLKLAAPLTAKEIHGGNLNYAFEVQDAEGVSVFVKQAPDFIKVLGKDAKLHKERLKLEVQVFREWASFLGPALAQKFLPQIYCFDEDHMLCVMEFLGSYRLLQEQLFAGTASLVIAASLGEFMGTIHAMTHVSKVSATEASRLESEYQNGALRDVQLEYVFSKCFREDARAAHLRDDDGFMQRLEELKALYRGENKKNLALLHGDLHAGSVMADDAAGSAKVIDPEFTIYGPPGLDVGSLLSTYAMAACFHKATGAGSSQEELVLAVERIWSSYCEALERGGIDGPTSKEIECEAVGFAGCEIARTALGMACERSLKIADEEVKKQAELAALALGAECVARRAEGLPALTGALRGFAVGARSSATQGCLCL